VKITLAAGVIIYYKRVAKQRKLKGKMKMNTIEKNGKTATVRNMSADGSVRVFFENDRRTKNYKTQASADCAVAKYFSA
jgi:hypothetical protein